MLIIPQTGVVRVQHNTGSVGTATIGTAVTTGAAAGTKGNPVQLIASTLFDAYWVTIMTDNYAAATTASRGCLDILIGAATEHIIIPDLLFGNSGGISSTAKHGPKRWDFPLYIPAGSRLSAAAAGDRTSTNVGVSIYLFGGDGMPKDRCGGRVTTYGVTVPAGTAITPGASGAEGAWTEIVASSSYDHIAFLPSFQEGGTTINLRNYTIDLGIGAAGAEKEICSGFWFQADTNESIQGPFPSMAFADDVPAGTRLCLRASNSGTNDAGGYSAAIHAVS